MNVNFYVGVVDEVKCLGQAPVGESVIEIDLQDLIRVAEIVGSSHEGESMKLFVVFDGAIALESDIHENLYNVLDDYAGSDSVG